ELLLGFLRLFSPAQLFRLLPQLLLPLVFFFRRKVMVRVVAANRRNHEWSSWLSRSGLSRQQRISPVPAFYPVRLLISTARRPFPRFYNDNRVRPRLPCPERSLMNLLTIP